MYGTYSRHIIVSIPFVMFALRSLSLLRINSRKSDPGSHSRFFFPLLATVRALHFYREKTSVSSSFVGSRRITPSLVTRSQQLIPSISYCIHSETRSLTHREIRAPGPTQPILAIEGNCTNVYHRGALKCKNVRTVLGLTNRREKTKSRQGGM